MTIERDKLVSYLNELLNVSIIQDNSCNGLQVQGNNQISKIGLAVDACLETYKLAAENNCQMLITHHGIIWHGLKNITQCTYDHIKFLLANNLNLYASHLPLDMHEKFGNNIQLAQMLNMNSIKPFGKYEMSTIGYQGELLESLTITELSDLLQEKLKCNPILLPFGKKDIKTMAIVSGGGSSALPEAIETKADCFITGESSHWNHHAAKEAGLNVIYLGHYQSETLGVKALGKHLGEKFGTKTEFIDIPTIV